MKNVLQTLYKRYNQFEEYHDSITVPNQFLMINIYKEFKKAPVNVEQKIMAYVQNDILEKTKHFQELSNEKEFVQPKSIFIRIYLKPLTLYRKKAKNIFRRILLQSQL